MIGQSKQINLNYAAKVVRIDDIIPIEGADRIVKAVIGNDTAIISKGYKKGDLMIFFPCETVICSKYLGFHNLFELSECSRNSNYGFIKSLQERLENASPAEAEEIQAVIKSGVGFFNKTGRVRILKLRKEYSMGYITPVETLEAVWPELKGFNWATHVEELFDSINGELICWKYVPPIKERQEAHGAYAMPWYKKRMKKLKRFDRLVPGQFAFHYDTGKLENNMHALNPNDDIDITVKVHGTSVILANVLTNRKLSLWEKFKKFLGYSVETREYGNIYSSRRVIKNQYINPGQKNAFYSVDVHGACARDFMQFIPAGVTVYGEIVGYQEGTSTFIQKNHDYGCKPGEWKFMPYRITTTQPNGVVCEWEIEDVMDWVDNLSTDLAIHHPNLRSKLMKMNHLYHGKVGDLYDKLIVKVAQNTTLEEFEAAKAEYLQDNQYLPRKFESVNEYVFDKWRTQLLETMRNDATWLGLEKKEPMCINKVPREGIVIRKCHDERAEAFKLKSKAHFELEKKQHDAGEWDIEEG